jgi:UDP-N-acetylmuramate: L-alanyl-gamma-D-glutamyl-meso-diaminopimelate ligase
VWTYGEAPDADYRLLDVVYGAGEVHFTYRDPEAKDRTMVSKLPGRHNLLNTLAVLAVAAQIGIAPDRVQEALLSFQGIKRRQDVLGEIDGIVIIDDFAHHPTAVRETIEAIRRYYPERRLWALFEPRSNSSRRNVFQDDYSRAFDGADLIGIKEPPQLSSIPLSEQLDTQALVAEIVRRGKEAHRFEATDHILAFVMDRCLPGDVMLIMSNGSFDGLPPRLLAALQDRPSCVVVS